MQRSRLMPRSILMATLALYVGLNLLIVFVLFPTGLLRVLSGPTGGLVSSTLVANLLMLAVLGGLLWWRGGLGADDLGLQRSGLAAGLAVLLALWLGVNAIEAAFAALAGQPVGLSPDGSTARGRSALIGTFLGQVLGNATLEEILFRGVLFQQLRLYLLARDPARPTRALVAALIVSQIVFSAIHIPLRLSSGMTPAELPAELALLFVLGLLLALLYWRCGNLYVVIAVHALSNAPTLLVQQQVDLSTDGVIAAVGSILVMLLWPRAEARAPAGLPQAQA